MTKIKATKGEFVNTINGLFAVQDLPGKKFSLIVSKNITLLKEGLQDLEDAGRPNPKFKELADEVNLIAQRDEEDSKAKIDKLEEDNKELVTERRKQMEDVSIIMQEEMSLDLTILSEDLLPEDITAKQINQLEKIIK